VILYDEILTADAVIDLGDADAGTVSRFLVTVHDESSMTVSIQPNGAARGTGITKKPVGYTDAGTMTDVNGETTPITAEGNFLIEASGMDIELDATVAAGSVRIAVTAIRG
jgi:hypothetical protein